ncbi:WXG100 family type VII secretion target [Nonomuraea sp. NPDC059194]|uniref:WXG100 family type VII secretion target n=1 Tax=Nonomuraea sp. NPDC059194 TaxID=3346764 RepID=UPI0036866100
MAVAPQHYSDRVSVNFQQMDLTVGDLDAIVRRFETRIGDLLKDLQLILGTGDGQDQAGDEDAWGGGAKTFFEEKKVKWMGQAAQMRAELEAAKQHVRVANENYQIAERANVNAWQS